MPSKNNKNKKTNNKKLNIQAAAPSLESTERAMASDMKPHFFDKNKIEFSFSEKKSSDKAFFVSENESAENGFVDAHFYPHTSSNKTAVTPQKPAKEPEKDTVEPETLPPEASGLEIAIKSEIADELKNETVSDKADFVILSEPEEKIEASKPSETSIGIKKLLEEEAQKDGNDQKDKGFFILPDENISDDEPIIVRKSKSKPVVFTPADSDSRRENEAILAALSPSDIRSNSETEKRRSPISFVRYAAMTLCLAVLVVSSYNLVSGFVRKQREKSKNDEFRDAFNSGEIGYTTLGYARQDTNLVPDERLYSDEGTIYKAAEPEVYDMHEKYVRMLPNLQALKYVNSSAFAWIKVGGTRVDYPVVRSPQGDNDYYLSHGLDRTYSVSGSVFTDYNNSTKLSNNRNTCVYGHNMNDGTMFQTIMNFKEKNQFLNSTIELYTADGLYVYTPFAVYDAIPTESFFKTEFASDEEFLVFLSDIQSKTIFKNNDITLDKDSKVVTLITCTNTVTDKRFVVHGVLDEIVK